MRDGSSCPQRDRHQRTTRSGMALWPGSSCRVLDLDLARQHVDALEHLPRPTLISCRTGPRASAVAYLYAVLKAGATPEDVLAAAEHDDAPFCAVPEYKAWVRSSMEALHDEVSAKPAL